MTAPLVPLGLAFAGGVGIGLEVWPPGWLPLAGGVLLALAAVAAHERRIEAASVAVLLATVLAGWARVALPDPGPQPTALGSGPVRVEGLLAGDPEVEGPRTRLPLLLQAVVGASGPIPARGRLLVDLYGRPPALRPPDRIRVTVALSRFQPLRNPHAAAGLRPRAGPLAVGRADSVERQPPGPVPWWLRTRLWAHRVVQAHLPPVSAALFEGLLLGERRQLPPPLVADFRAAGVFHILAISGFNVGLVAAAIHLGLRLLHVPLRAAAAGALGGLLAFAAVVGAQPSVLRATLMAALVLVARLIERESSVWNSLAAALLVLLAWDPASLADPGLQLSFAATAGILYLAPPIRTALAARTPVALADAAAVSAGAQLAVTPLMVAYWSEISLVGVLANLVVVPLAALLTTLGLLGLATAAVSEGLAHTLFRSLWILLLALRLAVRAFASLPGATLPIPALSPWALAGAAGALVLAPVTRGPARLLPLALAATAVAVAGPRFLPDGRLRLTVLDVGPGEAVVVRAPDGTALLVDTGGGGPGRADRGARVVLLALRRVGIRRLAVLALTHADPAHTGGLASLLQGVPVEEVWVPAGMAGPPAAPNAAAGAVGTRGGRVPPVRAMARGARAWLGPVLVRVLHPEPPETAGPGGRADLNDRGLVLRLDWGLAAILLMGDAGGRVERALAAAGAPLDAPILKVGQHGSRHASSPVLLGAVRPVVALVSVGARNPFGHPSPDTLARLASAGAAVYRTDVDGAIEVTTDGATLGIRRWADPDRIRQVRLDGAP